MLKHTVVWQKHLQVYNKYICIKCKIKCYKSALGPKLRGMALSSVRIHRNSPQIHMIAKHAMFKSHHDTAVGKCPLYIQHINKCMKWAVQEKSRHCFVRCTRNHSPHAPVNELRTNDTMISFPGASRTWISWYLKRWSSERDVPTKRFIDATHNPSIT